MSLKPGQLPASSSTSSGATLTTFPVADERSPPGPPQMRFTAGGDSLLYNGP